MKKTLISLALIFVVAITVSLNKSGPADSATKVEELTLTGNETVAAPRKPNILLIISDDIGMDVTTNMYPGLIDGLVARYGPSGLNHPQYSAIAGHPASTPNLNSLARQAMIFSNVWANPFCSPTRASILTGLYGARNDVLSYADPLSQMHTSFVRQLRDEAGYSTAVFGKWHMAWLAFNLSHATVLQQPSAMAVPNADTLDAVSLKEMQDCGGEFGSNNTGTCSGESLMCAMTNSVDTVIGKVLDAVDAIDPNTYVIFIGDNGTPMYARPDLDFIDNMYITKIGRGKGTAYESGARVAMAIRGPGITANTVNDEYIHATDLFPTSLALAGLQSPALVSNTEGSGEIPSDGISLAPILFENAKTVRDPNRGYILTESLNLMTEGSRQVEARNASYKVICSENTALESCEFYNLQNDPLEEYPLAKPETCAGYTTVLNTGDEQWHYCRLNEVVATQSFL